MMLDEFIVEARKTSPEQFQQLSDEQAITLITAVFDRIRNEISSMGDGMIVIEGFGRFRVRALPTGQRGNISSAKRTVFTPYGELSRQRNRE